MNVSARILTAFIEDLFVAARLAPADARLCAEVHVLQEMRGVTTHGLCQVPLSLDRLTRGQINPLPNRIVLRDEAATIVLDGDQGMGVAGCMDAMHRTIAKARQFGIGIGVVIHSNHFLSAAPYCLRATEHDMIGICFSNTWPSMGYPGTNLRVIANSPIGFGAPNGREFPIIFDSALTASGGKLLQWIREKKTIPEGLLGINEAGNSTIDPAAVLQGGTPWPIGGHKGAGLAVLVEVLTGVLGGSGFLHGIQPPNLRTSEEGCESQCCIVIDVARFMSLAEFHQRLRAFIADLKGNSLAPGYTEILLPGERAHRAQLRCLREGVTFETGLAADLRSWAQRLQVIVPLPV
jgi:LDH2 family malate/lactate/ureidoglycolate dehydrogenase